MIALTLFTRGFLNLTLNLKRYIFRKYKSLNSNDSVSDYVSLKHLKQCMFRNTDSVWGIYKWCLEKLVSILLL